jgi:protein subunit release factor B
MQVRVTHVNSGCVAVCSSARSQGENIKQVTASDAYLGEQLLTSALKAMSMLQGQLTRACDQANKDKLAAVAAAAGSASFGRSAHLVRSYVLNPYQLVSKRGVEVQTIMKTNSTHFDLFIHFDFG